MARPTSGASASCSSYLLGFPPVDCRPPYGWAAWWSSARDVEGRPGRFFGLKLYSRLAKGRCGETRRLVLRRVKFWRESTPARVESVVHRMIFIAGVRPAPLRERLSLGRIAVQHQRYKRDAKSEKSRIDDTTTDAAAPLRRSDASSGCYHLLASRHR